jgi:plasmid stabilization system protein ParE
MTTIHWTDAAEDTYLAILGSIYEKSTAAALYLDEQLEALLSKLRRFKYHCPPLEKIPGLRRCMITPDIALVYDVSGEIVTVISVYHTRSSHPFA